jgi:acyl CoA:acetate/3-ketoacid CoA transferase alpha subunit
VVIVEVEQIVPVGSLSLEEIHTPGIFVDHLVQVERDPRLFDPKKEGRAP